MRIIIGHAKYVKDTMNKLEDVSSEVMEHFIKLMIFPYSRNCNHWKQEIAAFLHKVPVLKSSKKYPSYDEIMKHIYYAWADATTNWIDQMVIDYPNEKILPVTYEVVSECMYIYFDWLSRELSKSGLVAKQRIYDKLDEIQQICIDKSQEE